MYTKQQFLYLDREIAPVCVPSKVYYFERLIFVQGSHFVEVSNEQASFNEGLENALIYQYELSHII